MKHHQTPIGKSDIWFTPKYITNKLGEFDLDPCTSSNRPWSIAKNNFTEAEDGLDKKWFGRIWCNPPFNRAIRPLWMKKMAKYNNGILLIPAACETKAFKLYVWGKASGILFLDKRPHFCDSFGIPAKANSGCTICLIAYGKSNLEFLKNSNLGYVCTQIT